ncbi:MAG: hypothetical protein Fur0032_00990 [Terrimicrobiaceae bacterium]
MSLENMRAAYLAVKANRGAPGVDGVEVQEMEKHLREHWESIRSKLLEGRYQPAAVWAVEIPKASGGVRLLGIPTVIDRMMQQAIQQEMGPTFEEGFSENSYEFRPMCSAHDAVKAGRDFVASGKRWVVDIDLKSFFDQANHDRLMTMISRKVRDKRVLSLIGRYGLYHGNLRNQATESRLIQPPDAENRTSGGVGALTGETPVKATRSFNLLVQPDSAHAKAVKTAQTVETKRRWVIRGIEEFIVWSRSVWRRRAE